MIFANIPNDNSLWSIIACNLADMAAIDKRYLNREDNSEFAIDKWYKDIQALISRGAYPSHIGNNKAKQKAFFNKCKLYHRLGDELTYVFRGVRKRYIRKEEVAQLLQKAYNKEGHFQKDLVLRKLIGYHQLIIAKDIKEYILGCYKYTKYRIAIRNQILLLVRINSPGILLGIDFIGLFRKIPLTRSTLLKYIGQF